MGLCVYKRVVMLPVEVYEKVQGNLSSRYNVKGN